MLVLPGNFANISWLSDSHWESGELQCVNLSIGVFGGVLGGSGRKRDVRVSKFGFQMQDSESKISNVIP